MIRVSPSIVPELDKGFVPAVLWNRAYREEVSKCRDGRNLSISIGRPDGRQWVLKTRILPQSAYWDEDTMKYCERLVKFLLWAWGGSRIRVAGAPDVAVQLQRIYSPGGARQFDCKFMGESCFREAFLVEIADGLSELPEGVVKNSLLSDMSGSRIGFDLGGSDRKCAAIVDGKVVFSEEVKWNPYFESDPEYHYQGILNSLESAAMHLPRVDAIGGSAAGIYINNEPRVGSLFRGISKEDFDTSIRGIFKRLQKKFNGVQFCVENDGDVTALAGAMMIRDIPVLGISMGTSLAAGYVNDQGSLTGWLNELAFVPVDYSDGAPLDEWSGDSGCGVQYFSQQAIGRLLDKCGIGSAGEMTLPQRLEWVQEQMAKGDPRIPPVYRTIGTYLGYTIPHFGEFYGLKHLLLLGRVTSGTGGDLIIEQARKVMDAEFPEVSEKVSFQVPDETTKRHGQAIAAASIPKLFEN